LAVCRLSTVRFRLDRRTFAAASRSNRRLGGRLIHFSVALAFAVVFGPSRSVIASLVRQRRVWSSDRTWPVRGRWWDHHLRVTPTHIRWQHGLRPALRSGAERTSRPSGFGESAPLSSPADSLERAVQPLGSVARPGRSNNDTDSSAVGQGTSDAGRWGREDGPPSSDGMHVRIVCHCP
jgi:hypothetical protein